MKTSKATKNTSIPQLSGSLNQVLADSYALLSLTHLAHWNVEGPGFFALHTAFQTQYEELFMAIDEIAERIRALDAYAIGGLGKLAQVAQMKEFAAPCAQEDYVRMLIAGNEKLVADAAQAREAAGAANDQETQDLMRRAHHHSPKNHLDVEELPQGVKFAALKVTTLPLARLHAPPRSSFLLPRQSIPAGLAPVGSTPSSVRAFPVSGPQ